MLRAYVGIMVVRKAGYGIRSMQDLPEKGVCVMCWVIFVVVRAMAASTDLNGFAIGACHTRSS